MYSVKYKEALEELKKKVAGRMAFVRGRELYELDEKRPLRFSHENEEVKQLYAEFLKI